MLPRSLTASHLPPPARRRPCERSAACRLRVSRPITCRSSALSGSPPRPKRPATRSPGALCPYRLATAARVPCAPRSARARRARPPRKAEQRTCSSHPSATGRATSSPARRAGRAPARPRQPARALLLSTRTPRLSRCRRPSIGSVWHIGSRRVGRRRRLTSRRAAEAPRLRSRSEPREDP